MKKIIILIMSLMLLLGGCSKKSDYLGSGKCGDNASWQVEKDGTLRVTGTGIITKWFLEYNTEEYEKLHDVIKRIVIEEGITGISPDASFRNAKRVEEIILPDTFEGEITEEFGHSHYLKHVRIGKSMKQTSADYMYNCEKIETIENASDYEIPLLTAHGARKWYVGDKRVKKCPPHTTVRAVPNTYKITYDLNGADPIDLPDSHQFGVPTKLEEPVCKGKQFMGWYGISKDHGWVIFYDEYNPLWGEDMTLKAMFADCHLEQVDDGFKVTVTNAKDFEKYEQVICFRYADNKEMNHPIWGDQVAPKGKGIITGLEKGKTYYVELDAIYVEWYTDANPEEDVDNDANYRCQQSITLK